jgi:radical SAM protein with 4Fe4S-binding SPASM domain
VIVRYEPWGAWVKLETQPAVVALDRDGVRALGLDGGGAWHEPERGTPPPSPPLELHLAVTSRCAAGCEGCYLDARPDGVDPPRAALEAALDALAAAGVFTVAFGGGEPTLRADLGELADAARARGLTPVVTTSGLGLNPARSEALARFDQVNVSYDGPDDAYAAVRGFDGASHAEAAIQALAAAGVRVGVNVVLTRATFDRAAATVRRARDLGAREVQLLRYKPAGRATGLDYLERRLSPAQVLAFPALVRDLSREHEGTLHVRVDCALVPFLSADADLAARPAELARWGVLGCEAGALLGAARVDGRLAPCSFAPPTDAPVTALRDAWRGDIALAPFRQHAAAPPEPCASCTLSSVCRGGCKVVSAHLAPARVTASGFAPDPECPRVRAAEIARA